MQSWLRNLPIRSKLSLVILGTCTVILSLACAALFAFQFHQLRLTLTQDLTAIAEIVANPLGGALMFKDADSARTLLEALNARPEIVGASIQREPGEVWVTIGYPTPTDTPNPQGARLAWRYHEGQLLIAASIQHQGEDLGVLHVVADIRRQLRALLQLYLVVTTLVLATSLALAILIATRLQTLVTRPILRLAETVRTIAQHKDYTVRAAREADDEIGVFTDGFNQMLTEIHERDLALQDARRELAQQVLVLQEEIRRRETAEASHQQAQAALLETSRMAGMAEVATSVLHNVGNVLNSVNVATTLLQDRTVNSKVPMLGRAFALLHEHADQLGPFFTDHPKGRQLLGYLDQLAGFLESDRQLNLQELDALTRHVEHIKEIVAMQQSYARVSGLVETLPLTDLVEDALRLNQTALNRHEITVIKQFENLPPLPLDKHRVLQILVNLIRNAKQAMAAQPPESRRLTLRLHRNGGEKVRIEVTDSGEGIEPANLTRVFSLGYTTRKNGHGFGLHGSALAAREMGGSLTAASHGRGHGATFTLELPATPAPPHA